MKRSVWLALLLALSLALGMALACSGGDDDDDDDTVDDDNDSTDDDDDTTDDDDDSGGECELADLCEFEMFDCLAEGWDSVGQCIEETSTWLDENCGSVNDAIACFCDCYADDADCYDYAYCYNNCVTDICS